MAVARRARGVRGRRRRTYTKRDFPVDEVRRFLEPGPVVLVSSMHRGRRNVMTMGWHMVLGFEPSLVGCYIWDENTSFAMIRASRECVINVPEVHLIETVIDVGNTHGSEIDKFEAFGLTPVKGAVVAAPLIAECYASFECRLFETRMIERLNLFVFEVVKAHVATSPRYPTTIHYRGDGVFMISGRNVSYRRRFRPENL